MACATRGATASIARRATSHRRRRPGPLRGDRLPAGRERGRRELRLAQMEGFHCYNPDPTATTGRSRCPILEQPQPRLVRDHRRDALPGTVDSRARRRPTSIPTTASVGSIRGPGGQRELDHALLRAAFNVSGSGEDEAGEVYFADPAATRSTGSTHRPPLPPSPASFRPPSSPAIRASTCSSTVRFVYGSVVRWNGADRPTTFALRLQIPAAISAVDIPAAGTASVTVFTPAPGGGTSAPLTVEINPTFLDVPSISRTPTSRPSSTPA